MLSCPAHHCRTAQNFFCTQYYANKCVRHIHNVLEARYISSLLAFLLFQHPESLRSTASPNISRCVMTQDNPPEKRNVKWKKIKNQLPPNVEALSPALSTSQHHHTHPLSAGWWNWFHFTFVRFVTCSGLMNTRQKKLYVHTCAAE